MGGRRRKVKRNLASPPGYNRAVGKLLLLGYFGAGNLGDDGFVVDFLKRWEPQLRANGQTCNYTAAGGRNPLDGFVEAEQIGDLLGSAVTRKALLTVRPRDYVAMVAPGGSLLQNATSMRSLLFYLHVISRFTSAGVPVYMLGQGLGPFRGKLAGGLVAKTLKHVTLLTLRDKVSWEWAKENGVSEAVFSADALLSGRLQPTPGRVSGCNAVNYGVFIPKPSKSESQQETITQESKRSPQQLLADYLEGLSDYDNELISLHLGQDSKLVDELAGSLGGCSLDPDDRLTADVLNIIALGWMVVSYRLHGLILAAAYGVPSFGIAYDPKITAFCTELDLPYCSPLDVADKSRSTRMDRSLSTRISHLWHNREQVKATMLERRAVALQRLEAAETRFAQLLWGAA
jgi:polysaccharide pyruvyl transferase CsaB